MMKKILIDPDYFKKIKKFLNYLQNRAKFHKFFLQIKSKKLFFFFLGNISLAPLRGIL